MARRTILLVEDDAGDVELLQLAFDFARTPLNLQRVSQGREAIQYLTGQGAYSDRDKYPQPCLVLLDLKLPVMDGFEVLRWMQKQAGDFPPVIVLSYSRHERDRQLAVELGAKSFISKPVDLTSAVDFVKEFVRPLAGA